MPTTSRVRVLAWATVARGRSCEAGLRGPQRARRGAGPAIALALLILAAPAHAQNLDFERGRGTVMLKTIHDDLVKNYYDAGFRGLDLEKRFRETDTAIAKADSIGQIFGLIAQALLALDDSHSLFVPPLRSNRYDYGFVVQMIGESCYVTSVRPESDAEAKGLRPGDRVISFAGLAPTRASLWKIQYIFYSIWPQAAVRLAVAPPGGPGRDVEIKARVRPRRRLYDFSDESSIDFAEMVREEQSEARRHPHVYSEADKDVFVWKMPAFDLEWRQVKSLFDNVGKRPWLILDLRGNPGGLVETLKDVTGWFFEKEVRLADMKSRRETKPLVAKGRGGDAFRGKVVVLVDSGSASAAEMLARVIQIEKRGVVVGDRSAGAVMRARSHSYSMGADTKVFYGASITDADVIMSDGASLERNGVVPDEGVVPTAEDLAAGRDPALARAFALAGRDVTAEQAGRMFPIEWEKP
jgi:C-terminal processing protease CtpA/Prc